METTKNTLLKYKLIYTFLILGVYMIGRGLPLYMIDVSAYMHKSVDAEALFVQVISGDVFRCSVFALGLSPFMISSIVTQVISACRGAEARAKISQARTNRLSIKLTLVMAIVQAAIRVQELQFKVAGDMLLLAKLVAAIEMVAGVMVIVYLVERNKRYGLAGQSALVFVNLLDSIRMTLQGHHLEELLIPLGISMVVMLIMLFMENTEKRIPVQRISIHNIYADKNYLAIKLNPIGVMPAMFSMAFFMVPQLIVTLLTWIFPENTEILWWQENMNLTRPLGITVYIIVLYGLTIGFSRVFVNPRELTEQFLKSGDSLQDIHAGRDTKRYLSKTIMRLGILSATVMSICLGVPLLLSLMGVVESTFATLPSSVMMLTSICCNVFSEVRALRDLEAYKPFI